MAIDKYNLIQMYNRDNYGNVENTIQDINELIADIDNNPKKFIYDLSNEIEEFAEKVMRCPLCGSKVIQLDTSYESSEYFGQPVQEKILTYGCESSSCSYIKR
jgi:hypothetical protein